MSKRQFKSQASSSRATPGQSFGGFGSASTASSLSYLSEGPNLTPISDPNVIVAFKNLSKKDATTKSKALEDFRTYVQEHPYETSGGPEDAVLEAWVKVYPRLSIDNSRRVRELAHMIQIELLRASRKRMEKHLPKLVGSWLAGVYDRDRGVARSANDGVKSILNTDTKVAAFWTKYQSQILEYAQSTFQETPQTLSDERTVNDDEMQEKYFRVVNSSVSLVITLLKKLGQSDIDKHQTEYTNFLSENKALWSLASCKDTSTRKSVHQLLLVTLARQANVIDDTFLKLISHSFVAEALVVPQLSSAYQLVQTLSALTHSYPSVWTSSYKSKKPAFTRLQRFIERGSQGGPPEYWPSFKSLWTSLPGSVLELDAETIISFLGAMRNGISSREESRSNQSSAWSAYFDICQFEAQKLDTPESKLKILEEAIFPAFEQYLSNTASNPKWSVGSAQNLVKAYTVLEVIAQTDATIQAQVLEKWKMMGDHLISQLQTSLPEQSKDFQKSQTSVTTQGHRWFELLGRVTEQSTSIEATTMTGASLAIVDAAIKVMKSRRGKPFSAAATLEGALRLASKFVSNSNVLQMVEDVLRSDLQTLVVSPSSKYLTSMLFRLRTFDGKEQIFEDLWSETIRSLLSPESADGQIEGVIQMLDHEGVSTLAQQNVELQKYLLDSSTRAIRGDSKYWPLIELVTRFGHLDSTASRSIVSQALECLEISSPYLQGAFRMLEALKQCPGTFEEQDTHVAIITKLLALTELSDSTIAPRAKELQALIEKSDRKTESSQSGTSSTVHVIRRNLDITNGQSLSVDTLIQQAHSVIESSPTSQELVALLPDVSRWSNELSMLFDRKPDSTLAVMRPFAGTVFLVEEPIVASTMALPFDVNGYSGPLRSAVYMTSLLGTAVFKDLPRAQRVGILRLLCLTLEITNDQLDVSQTTGVYQIRRDADTTSEIREHVSELQSALSSLASDSRSWRRNPEDAIIDTHDSSALLHELMFKLIKDCAGQSSHAYYSAKSLNRVISKLIDAHGWQNDGADEWLTKIDVLKSSTTNRFAAVGLLTGIADDLDSSKLINTLCNRLISDCAGATSASEKTLPLLVLLNSVIGVYAESEIPAAQNRLVFAVKQILSWAEGLPLSNPELSSEACRALQKLLPCIKGMYGSHWTDTLEFCHSIFISNTGRELLDSNIPMIGMALKLFSILQNLDGTNDDLVDSLAEYNERISKSLVNLLQLRRTNDNQPLAFVDSTLSRLAMDIPIKTPSDLAELYPVVASDFKEVQSSAFQLLSRALPEIQQEISVNVLLERTDARLPEELLSLLLDAPVFADIAPEDLAEFPVSVRGYLLSWHLIFSAFSTASFKVRNDYIENLKTENYITPLLDFLFHTLGHSTGRPLNIDQARFSEEEIRAYSLSNSAPDRDLQWLLLNIYYQALEYTPNLVKSWWLDCKSKTTRLAVETWTQKYFTIFVIQGVLDEVTQWADNQEPATETEKQLEVRVLRKAREIHASYEVDDTEAEIAIKFPPTYPLEGIKVEGVRRVAASEKKWTSWMMIIQGAITFANGSITDGLVIFRKNVAGALEGHSECAICYSIISPTKKTPNKRCMTCKNLFHSDCLFKWFSSSNQNTCPLCRNPFQYM